MPASNYRRVPSTELAQSQSQSQQQSSDAAATAISPTSAAAAASAAAAMDSASDHSAPAPPRWESSNNSTVSNASSANASSDRLTDKFIALLWVLAAILTAWWSKTLTVLFGGPDVSDANRPLLYIVALLLGVNTVFMLYLTVYLPKVKGLTDSSAWEVYCPAVIPTMTITGVTSFLLAVRATWPVWGFLTPAVLGMECLGCLFALHFVPWF